MEFERKLLFGLVKKEKLTVLPKTENLLYLSSKLGVCESPDHKFQLLIHLVHNKYAYQSLSKDCLIFIKEFIQKKHQPYIFNEEIQELINLIYLNKVFVATGQDLIFISKFHRYLSLCFFSRSNFLNQINKLQI